MNDEPLIITRGTVQAAKPTAAAGSMGAFGTTADGVPVTSTPWMTLRDHFAAQALQGLVRADWPKATGADDMADLAYSLAEAMMRRRER